MNENEKSASGESAATDNTARANIGYFNIIADRDETVNSEDEFPKSFSKKFFHVDFCGHIEKNQRKMSAKRTMPMSASCNDSVFEFGSPNAEKPFAPRRFLWYNHSVETAELGGSGGRKRG